MTIEQQLDELRARVVALEEGYNFLTTPRTVTTSGPIVDGLTFSELYTRTLCEELDIEEN